MLPYNPILKTPSRNLRRNMTDAEQLLWSKIRGKQIHAVQFYRQKPLAGYIVDFYSAAAKLVIELDGSQHFSDAAKTYDAKRTCALESMGLKIIRFDNLQVMRQLDGVMAVIFEAVGEQLVKATPLTPLLQRGDWIVLRRYYLRRETQQH